VALKCLTRQLQTDGRPGFDPGGFFFHFSRLPHTHTAARPSGGRRHSPGTKQPLRFVVSVQAALCRDAEVTSRLVLHSRFYKIHLCVKEKRLNRQMASVSPRVRRRRYQCVHFTASVISPFATYAYVL
jgi:hypothetical protein